MRKYLERDLSDWSMAMLIRYALINFRPLVRGLVMHQSLALVGRSLRLNNVKLRSGYKIGDYCKIYSPKKNRIVIGNSFTLNDFSVIELSKSAKSVIGSIRIGDNCGFGEYSYINGVGGLKIGSDVIAGQYLSIHPQNHSIIENETELFRLKPTKEIGIVIGNNVWIGAKVTILDGSKIGNNSVIAAGAVVKAEFPDNVLIAGVPARIIKELL